MPICELLWDDWNVEHIALHHVRPEEVEDLCLNHYWELNAGGGKRALYGQTSGGRYLLVIGAHRGGGLFYPITARDMTGLSDAATWSMRGDEIVPESSGTANGGLRFKSVEEEAAFWDSHSPLDYPDYWKEAAPPKAARRLGYLLGVRLDAKVIGELDAIAERKGIGPSTLAKIWLMERLDDERQRLSQKEAVDLKGQGRSSA